MVSLNRENDCREKPADVRRPRMHAAGAASIAVRPVLGPSRRQPALTPQPNGDPPDVMLWGDE